MKSILRLLLAVVCIIVIAACSTLIVQKIVGRTRVDFTQQGIYTLSQGTRNVLGKLNQPIKLKLYYSRTAAMKGPEQIRFYNNYYNYVRDLLEEYAGISGHKIELSVIDPRPFSDEEEEAVRFGLKKFPLSDDENFFFGLVAQTGLGKVQTIDFFEPGRQEFVEYDISKLISDVTRRAKKKVGVLSSLPVMGDGSSPYMMQMMRMQGKQPQEPWTIITQLRQTFDVEPVETTAESIPQDIDFLMVIHPKDLSEKTLFAIDQFVMKGGKLLAFVDPQCFSDQPEKDPKNPYAAYQYKGSSNLNKLLEGWGVKLEDDVIAADRNLAVKTRTPTTNSVAYLPVYLNLDSRCVSQKEVVTADLHSVRMLLPGVLKDISSEGVTVTPILTTTSTGTTWKPESPFELQRPDAEKISREIEDGTEPEMLACRISGNLKTNFPNGIADAKPADDTAKDEAAGKKDGSDDAAKDDQKADQPEVVTQASPEAAVLVFADVDMISDMLAYQDSFFGKAQAGDNASVVQNSLEFLGGTGDLIAIRSRGRIDRPFEVVDKIEAEVDKATAAQEAAINAKITNYRQELRKLGPANSEAEAKLVQSKMLAQRDKIQQDIWKAEKELRTLKAKRREKIEALKASLQTHNMVWAPLAVLLIAIVLSFVRTAKAKRYAARRS